jgi:hypothetical protein
VRISYTTQGARVPDVRALAPGARAPDLPPDSVTAVTMTTDFPLLSDAFGDLRHDLRGFRWHGKSTSVHEATVPLQDGSAARTEVFVNEFWTSRQRAASSLHEVSYRACFKPQLPRFFIERLTRPGDTVYDPFMGRGTTPIEAALLGRVPCGCDVNPLSAMLVEPRLHPPSFREVADRLRAIEWAYGGEPWAELLVFYHPETLAEIHALRRYLEARAESGQLDWVDKWIRMVAVNRLTGHSTGFFSVYSLPPNQAVSIQSQKKINETRAQTPPRRNVPELILAKTRSLLADCDERVLAALARTSERSQIFTGAAVGPSRLAANSVDLVVTSPPFLDVVDYATDNWLRCWFCGLDARSIELTILKRLADWEAAMTEVFRELRRVLRAGAHVAFEVGEVRAGTVRLEESVIKCAAGAGLDTELVLINAQKFTKTANCWGVSNNSKGTNSNRIALLRKP